MAVDTAAYREQTDEQQAIAETVRRFADAPLLSIGEGTSEIQQMVIGGKLLQRHKI